MSGGWYKNDVLYFPLPKRIFAPGRCKKLEAVRVCLLPLTGAQQGSAAWMITLTISLVHLPLKQRVQSEQCLGHTKHVSQCTRVGDGYRYHLLNPETGKSLLDGVKGEFAALDFDALNQTQLKCYYEHHLKDSIKRTNNGVMGCSIS